MILFRGAEFPTIEIKKIVNNSRGEGKIGKNKTFSDANFRPKTIYLLR